MNKLVLAVPSKGRLEELTREAFAKVGMEIMRPQGVRSYAGNLQGFDDVIVRFLPAGEIARELIHGTIDIGITGEDLIHESLENGAESVIFAQKLGFGNADVVVGVPDAWIDVKHMRDLSDVASDFRAKHGRWLRVATKYIHLTRKFFADNGIAEYRIVQSVGATEAAPATGAADLIVDITSTGATLKANGLRILDDGVMLKSEANLIISRTANWNDEKNQILQKILSKIGVEIKEI